MQLRYNGTRPRHYYKSLKLDFIFLNISQKVQEKNRNSQSDGNVPLPRFHTSHRTAVRVCRPLSHYQLHAVTMYGTLNKPPTTHQQTLTTCPKTGSGNETMNTFKSTMNTKYIQRTSCEHQETDARPQNQETTQI